jgi:crossover junction endodeoxyribonuclease RuvC
MKVLGIDLSLTSTGLASVVDTGASVGRIPTKAGLHTLADQDRRLAAIVEAVMTWATDTDLAVVEGPALVARTGYHHDRSGLWWLVVHRLLASSTPVAVVPPTVRAKYATGHGNAPKDQVLAAVIRRYPTIDITGNDEADALVLAAMGARRLGHPIDDLPLTHRTALTAATWPEELGLW